jgi:hypothetical protein
MFGAMLMRVATMMFALALMARLPLPQVCVGRACERAANRATIPPCCAPTNTFIPLPPGEGGAQRRVSGVVNPPARVNMPLIRRSAPPSPDGRRIETNRAPLIQLRI